jgi:hypothetical protein
MTGRPTAFEASALPDAHRLRLRGALTVFSKFQILKHNLHRIRTIGGAMVAVPLALLGEGKCIDAASAQREIGIAPSKTTTT